jgi:hypothetical protein
MAGRMFSKTSTENSFYFLAYCCNYLNFVH